MHTIRESSVFSHLHIIYCLNPFTNMPFCQNYKIKNIKCLFLITDDYSLNPNIKQYLQNKEKVVDLKYFFLKTYTHIYKIKNIKCLFSEM